MNPKKILIVCCAVVGIGLLGWGTWWLLSGKTLATVAGLKITDKMLDRGIDTKALKGNFTDEKVYNEELAKQRAGQFYKVATEALIDQYVKDNVKMEAGFTARAKEFLAQLLSAKSDCDFDHLTDEQQARLSDEVITRFVTNQMFSKAIANTDAGKGSVFCLLPELEKPLWTMAAHDYFKKSFADTALVTFKDNDSAKAMQSKLGDVVDHALDKRTELREWADGRQSSALAQYYRDVYIWDWDNVSRKFILAALQDYQDGALDGK